METTTWTNPENGRTYSVWKDGDQQIIIGPPQELVDHLELPEPFATRLHNALQRRGVLTFKDVQSHQRDLVGALQEALNLDAQRLTEAFYNLQKEEIPL